MDEPLSKAAPTQHHPPPTLIAPKATSVMENVTKRLALKKQQQKPSSTAQCLRAINETKSEDDRPLVFRKRKVAPPSDETSMTQVRRGNQHNKKIG